MLKTEYVIRAGMEINEAERIDPNNKVVLDIKGEPGISAASDGIQLALGECTADA